MTVTHLHVHSQYSLLAGTMPIVVGFYLRDALGLSLFQVGFMLGLYVMASSLTQLLFWYFNDIKRTYL